MQHRYPLFTCFKTDTEPIVISDDLCFADHRPWCETISDYNVETGPDHLRVYVPMDLSKQLILDSLDHIILLYGEANAYNENAFARDVSRLLLRIDLYDQIWCKRHALDSETHSPEAIELIQEVIERLENIPDGCAETFPFEMIEELKKEYLPLACL